MGRLRPLHELDERSRRASETSLCPILTSKRSMSARDSRTISCCISITRRLAWVMPLHARASEAVFKVIRRCQPASELLIVSSLRYRLPLADCNAFHLCAHVAASRAAARCFARAFRGQQPNVAALRFTSICTLENRKASGVRISSSSTVEPVATPHLAVEQPFKQYCNSPYNSTPPPTDSFCGRIYYRDFALI